VSGPWQQISELFAVLIETIEEECPQSCERTEAICRLREAFFWSWVALPEEVAERFRLVEGGKELKSPREQVGKSKPETGEPPPGA